MHAWVCGKGLASRRDDMTSRNAPDSAQTNMADDLVQSLERSDRLAVLVSPERQKALALFLIRIGAGWVLEEDARDGRR